MWAYTQDERFVNLRTAREIEVRVQQNSVEIVAVFDTGDQLVLGAVMNPARPDDAATKLKTQIRAAMVEGECLDIPEIVAGTGKQRYQGNQHSANALPVPARRR